MTTLNKLIQKKEKEFDKKSNLFVGNGGWCCRTDNDEGYGIWSEQYNVIKSFLSTAIQEGYELGIKDVEKIIGKNEEYSQSGYFKEDNGEIITNDEIQGMNILKNELRLKLQLLLKKESKK